jgi:hypothetical protein
VQQRRHLDTVDEDPRVLGTSTPDHDTIAFGRRSHDARQTLDGPDRIAKAARHMSSQLEGSTLRPRVGRLGLRIGHLRWRRSDLGYRLGKRDSTRQGARHQNRAASPVTSEMYHPPIIGGTAGIGNVHLAVEPPDANMPLWDGTRLDYDLAVSGLLANG